MHATGLFKITREGGNYNLNRVGIVGQDQFYTFAEFVKDENHIFAIQQTRIPGPAHERICSGVTLVLLQREEGSSPDSPSYRVIKTRELETNEKDKAIYVAVRNEDFSLSTIAIARYHPLPALSFLFLFSLSLPHSLSLFLFFFSFLFSSLSLQIPS